MPKSEENRSLLFWSHATRDSFCLWDICRFFRYITCLTMMCGGSSFILILIFMFYILWSVICFFQFVNIGIVTSIEVNQKPVDTAKKGQEICVKIEPIPGESPKMYGRHFEAVDIIVSKVGPGLEIFWSFSDKWLNCKIYGMLCFLNMLSLAN